MYKRQLEKGRKVDGIGVSSAGVYIDNKCMVASLFLKVGKEDFDAKVKNIYTRAACLLYTSAVCMSEDLTQRGSAALLPPAVRAAAALDAGADLVIGLPNPCAVQSAEGFAAAGVAALSALPGLDSLVFGAETPDTDALMETARVPVSYTHLDVYKRQGNFHRQPGAGEHPPRPGRGGLHHGPPASGKQLRQHPGVLAGGQPATAGGEHRCGMALAGQRQLLSLIHI